MTENELADRELWRTCVHEHGHAQVALALGYRCVIVNVWPNDDGNPDNSAWRGQIQYHENIPAGDMAIICLAGMVAEILLIDFPEDGYTFADAEQQAARIRACQTLRTRTRTAFTEYCRAVGTALDNWLMAGGEFSETDLAGMGEDWYKHLRKTVRLVKKQSEAILREANFRERSWKFEE